MLQQIALGGTMIALPIFLQMVLEYRRDGGRPVARPAVAEHVRVALLAGRKAGDRRPSSIVRVGLRRCSPSGSWCPAADRAPGRVGWDLVVPLVVAGSGLGLLVSQLNNYTLSPISEERVSEAAGVNSAAGSFGLSFGLAFAGAIMLATLSFAFTRLAEDSTVLPPGRARSRSPTVLEDDAEVMTNTQLEELLADQPADDPGRDRRHQHRRPAARAPGGAARADPRRAGRAGELVPDDPAARAGAVRRGGGDGVRMTSEDGPPAAPSTARARGAFIGAGAVVGAGICRPARLGARTGAAPGAPTG